MYIQYVMQARLVGRSSRLTDYSRVSGLSRALDIVAVSLAILFQFQDNIAVSLFPNLGMPLQIIY